MRNGKPVLVDGFCGAGGATKGYQRAGFYVIGVDIKPQPHYCGDEFIQADFMDFPLEGYDAVHASPPCQADSQMSACRPGLADTYPRLIAPMRERVRAWGGLYVIENVVGAPLLNSLLLCGSMFGLDLHRHRLFESNVPLPLMLHGGHDRPTSKAGHWRPGTIISVSGNCAPIAEARRAMGIDWMTRDELREAIPPQYAEFIGAQLLAALENERGAA